MSRTLSVHVDLCTPLCLRLFTRQCKAPWLHGQKLDRCQVQLVITIPTGSMRSGAQAREAARVQCQLELLNDRRTPPPLHGINNAVRRQGACMHTCAHPRGESDYLGRMGPVLIALLLVTA